MNIIEKFLIHNKNIYCIRLNKNDDIYINKINNYMINFYKKYKYSMKLIDYYKLK